MNEQVFILQLYKSIPHPPHLQLSTALIDILVCRAEICCKGPRDILTVLRWFLDNTVAPVPVIKIKNKFGASTCSASLRTRTPLFPEISPERLLSPPRTSTTQTGRVVLVQRTRQSDGGG